jgi:hypothetical protein
MTPSGTARADAMAHVVRIQEVASLLAAGILRLRSREAAEPVFPAEQVRLDFAPRQSVDADAEPEKETVA